MTVSPAIVHHYRHFRAHQWATWDRDGNSGGGAWPGEHASCAYWDARRHLHFMKRLEEYLRPKKKRRAKRRKP